MNPSESAKQWGLDDLALMVGALLPTIFCATVITRALKFIAPAPFMERAVEVFCFQSLFYGFTLLALHFVVATKHRQPFWSALGWTFHFPGAMWCVLLGPVLMVCTSLTGALLHAPVIRNPWEDLITGKGTQFTVILFAAILGPIWEELLFRGFLFPLLERFLGTWPAIFASALPFGLIHGSQSDWVWQYVVLIALTGVAFAFVRYRTGSTAAAAISHSAYNATQFIFFLLQNA